MGMPFCDFLYLVRFGARELRCRTWVRGGVGWRGDGRTWREDEAWGIELRMRSGDRVRPNMLARGKTSPDGMTILDDVRCGLQEVTGPKLLVPNCHSTKMIGDTRSLTLYLRVFPIMDISCCTSPTGSPSSLSQASEDNRPKCRT